MVYHTDGMILSPVREVFRGEVNDVLVCQDLRSPVRACYTLSAVKDRVTAKRLLAVLEHALRKASSPPCAIGNAPPSIW